MSTGTASGSPNNQCLDVSSMAPNYPDTSIASKGNGHATIEQGLGVGQILLEQCADSIFRGQNVTPTDASKSGQHGKGSYINTEGNAQATLEQSLGVGQHILDQCADATGSGQNVIPTDATGIGQHANDSDMNMEGLNSEQQGVESDKANGGTQSSTLPPQNKKSFASLFQNSRAPTEASKLMYIAPPTGKLVLRMEEIDSVETAFGYCLVGYVMGPRPSPYTIRNFVLGWDKDVKFTFKENGWIRFQFPSEAVRDKILNGGPYILFGRQLFLKKLPSCFLFSKEDMEFFPSWVQIFGLPADCWTTQALSRISSVVGKPLHTDLITISKKGATYARILVELDAKKTRVREYSVELPTGKEIMITFKYEFEPKYCDKCGLLGHTVDMCGIKRDRALKKKPNRLDTDLTNIPVHNNTEKDVGVACSGSHGSAAESSGTTSGKDKDLDVEQTYQLHSHLEDACLPNPEVALPDISLDDDGKSYEDKNSVQGSDMSSPHLGDFDLDSDDLLDFLPTVVTKDKEEWKTVKGKNKNKKQMKIIKKKVEGKSVYDEGMRTFFDGMKKTSPCEKLLPIHRDYTSKGQQERAVGKQKVNKVRPPDTAFGCP